MKPKANPILAAALVSLTASLLLPVLGAGAAEPEVRSLTGLYFSSYQDGQRRLRAEFTPREELEWDVVFYFRFNGRNHEYSGTAKGSLLEGPLRGQVRNESGQRTFTFDGEFKKGKFRGTHAELRRGRESRTGTLSLQAGKS